MDDFRTINRSEYHGVEGVSSAAAQNAFINRVYGWMSAALALTGAVAYFVAQNPAWIKTIYQNPILFWGILIGQLLLVMGLSGAINRISASTALLGFILYAALNGLIFSGIFLVYTKASLASTFFATSLTFGVTSLIGYVTKKDLTGFGGFLMMGLVGVIIGSVINIFWQNSMLYWIMTYAGIFIFVGLAAYDTQKIRRMSEQTSEMSGEMSKKLSIMGALALYLDFINLFLLLLRLFGGRRN